mgnify:CR=1 FL=1
MPRMPDMSGVQTGFGRLLGTLAGEASVFGAALEELTPYLPNDMVGGSVPQIAGTEAEAVWHAAAQACGTERVHYCFSADGGRVWFLAVPSSSLSSSPNSWCPLAAALPGQSEHWDKDTVYLYEQEGQASALRWDPESNRMQLFLGPSRSILPRIQSMNANFVTINPETARPLPWINRTLKMERMSRYLSLLVLLLGVALTLGVVMYIMYLNLMLITIKPALDSAKVQTRQAAEQLTQHAYQAFATNTPKHLVRTQELHQTLFDVGGILTRYELKPDGKVEWEALVPQAIVASENPAFRNSKPTAEIGEDGRVRIIGSE